ncbi:MAG: alpha-1,2-fucosyltransferase [Candidatus Pacebacteria bacterium]|nr:alpha-1,2-fucosyltransferase [Candidatus Paceibacterota bacterium]
MKKQQKKAIILQHNGRGQMANQLWNFISIYAYSLEKGYKCRNYSFFEYSKYFNIPVGNWFINLKFFVNFNIVEKIFGFKKTQDLWRKIYKLFIVLPFEKIFENKIVFWSNSADKDGTYHLPPSKPSSGKLLELENSNSNVIYFHSWLFRNPEGITKYRKEILEYFKPKEKYTRPVETKIKELKNQYKNIIGVHIRQKDYKKFRDGRYFVPQERINEILGEYLIEKKKDSKETIFIITSDGPVKENIYSNLNIEISKYNPIEDLYLLSLCDVVIGSNSTYGNFASYYGNNPHIVFQKEKIDWEYYKEKNKYFENKYCTIVQY